MDENSAEFVLSLGRLIRGLTILFWGLPITLLVCVRTSVKERFELQPLDFFIPIVVSATLLVSIFLLGEFKKNEKSWIELLDRAKFFGIINLLLSPFIYWRLKVPEISAFSVAVWLFFVSNTLFLLIINRIIQHLSRMLPENTLREDAKTYGDLNQYMLAGLLVVLILGYAGNGFKNLPAPIGDLLFLLSRYYQWILTFIVVVPLAITMALLWKTKEVILTGIFIDVCKSKNDKPTKL